MRRHPVRHVCHDDTLHRSRGQLFHRVAFGFKPLKQRDRNDCDGCHRILRKLGYTQQQKRQRIKYDGRVSRRHSVSVSVIKRLIFGSGTVSGLVVHWSRFFEIQFQFGIQPFPI